MDVLSVPNGDDLDLDTGLSNVNDSDNLVGLLSTLGLETSLFPGLRKTGSVTNEDGSRLVDDLDDVDASGLGSGLEGLSLRSFEGRRGGDDTAVLGGDTEEVGSGLEERLEEKRGDLGNGQGQALGRGLGGGLDTRGSGRVLGRLLGGGGRRRRDEDLDGVTGNGASGRDDGSGRGEGRGETSEVVEPDFKRADCQLTWKRPLLSKRGTHL